MNKDNYKIGIDSDILEDVSKIASDYFLGERESGNMFKDMVTPQDLADKLNENGKDWMDQYIETVGGNKEFIKRDKLEEDLYR